MMLAKMMQVAIILPLFAFVKIAQLDYKLSSKVKLSMGMIGGKLYKTKTNLGQVQT